MYGAGRVSEGEVEVENRERRKSIAKQQSTKGVVSDQEWLRGKNR
jgi:hypothetical protein